MKRCLPTAASKPSAGPGPGGQKRNKTSSAVRITHLPSGLAVTAGESRSQAENRSRALRRLRHKVVLDFRLPIRDAPIALAADAFDISLKNENYLQTMALVLDVLHATEWSVSQAAATLATSTGRLISFLSNDEALWAYVNQQRAIAKLRPLNPR